MAKMKLGTLRYIYTRTMDTLTAGNYDSIKETVREGDRFSYAIDGILIDAASITNAYKLAIDFSIFKPEGETKILQLLPYSLRGIRGYSKLIPTRKDTDYPVLPARQPIYVKLTNNDSTNDVSGIAYAVLGYPVLEER